MSESDRQRFVDKLVFQIENARYVCSKQINSIQEFQDSVVPFVHNVLLNNRQSLNIIITSSENVESN